MARAEDLLDYGGGMMADDFTIPSFEAARLAEARDLLERDTEDLLRSLGAEGQEHGFPEDFLRAGKLRYQAVVRSSRETVCRNDTVRLLCTSHKLGDGAHLLCAISDTILHASGVPVPAMTIAAILVRNGLESFCETYW